MSITNYLTLKQAVTNWLDHHGVQDIGLRIPEWIGLAEDRIAQELRVQAQETSRSLLWKATTAGGTVGGTADAITLTPTTAATSYAAGDTYSFTVAATNTGGATTVNISGLGTQSIKVSYGGTKENPAAGDLLIGETARLYYDGTDFLIIQPGAVPLPTNFLEHRRFYLDDDEKPLDYMAPEVFWGRNAVNETNKPKIYTIEGDFIIAAPIPDGTYRGRLLYYRRFTDLSSNTDTNWIVAKASGLLLYGALVEAYAYLEDDAELTKWANMYDGLLSVIEERDQSSRHPSSATMRSQVAVI